MMLEVIVSRTQPLMYNSTIVYIQKGKERWLEQENTTILWSLDAEHGVKSVWVYCMSAWERVCLLQVIQLSSLHSNATRETMRQSDTDRPLQMAVVEILSTACSDSTLDSGGWRKMTAFDKPPSLLLISSLSLFPLSPSVSLSISLSSRKNHSHLFAQWSKLNTLESN